MVAFPNNLKMSTKRSTQLTGFGVAPGARPSRAQQGENPGQCRVISLTNRFAFRVFALDNTPSECAPGLAFARILTVPMLLLLSALWLSAPATWAADETCASCGPEVSISGEFTHAKYDASLEVPLRRHSSVKGLLLKGSIALRIRQGTVDLAHSESKRLECSTRKL